MDIKEIAQEQVKTADGVVYENKTTENESNRYVVPKDSECIKDIEEVKDSVNTYIFEAFSTLKNDKARSRDHSKIIDNCKDALKFLEMYKNMRLNVELSSKIKFNVDPLPDKS